MAAPAMSPQSDVDVKEESRPTLTPPASDEADKHDDSGSDLSDLDMEPEDNGEIVPDHYYEGGKIPVFKPTMDQFRSFKSFISKIDKYGMKSGIVKVIPPKEWLDSLPPLDEQVKTVKVKNPITQEFHGTHGTYTQANIEKQRSYNLPQWKALCEESNHQPPAKRGERRRNQPQTTRNAPTRGRNQSATLTNGKKRGPGRPRVRPLPTTVHRHDTQEQGEEEEGNEVQVEVPPTPTSPATKPTKFKKEHLSDNEDLGMAKPKGRQPKSVSSRRQHNRRDQADVVDEEAFKDFDYRVHNQDEWTLERCNELETAYWKSLTFNNPMYGADMPGSLFDDSTEAWNVAKLENLLDVLGQKVPGVNTAYLYLGMWKASFAWHLEDVDLYSINYIHFGAPKQWYSISQEDARRFEAAMRSVWPTDAKNCDQFLRHKTYLISPQLLQSQYNIRVNRLVHHEGEFVITFPYGYHSGYNLGYNCAESVNFATESWLDYGKVARKCNCEADSVWVDVNDIERKLRGEPTPEYYEETEEDEDDEEDDDGPTDLPTPPGSDKGKPKRSHKRKRDLGDKGSRPKVKRLRIKLKAPLHEPCILCPSDNPHEKLLPTDNGHEAHRRCALYTPETYISEEGGSEKICDVARIDKARLELKCNYCRNKRGAVFQCSQKKCTRAYHATCAAAAGVQVDIGLVPVYGEDGTEYTDTGIDFRCRFHRIKRGKNVDGQALEDNTFIRRQASKLPIGELVQMQYYQGDIFAGTVLDNRKSEQTLFVEVLPKGDKIEIEYKWLLIFDPVNSQLPIPSENAKPLPPELAQKSRTTAEHPSNDNPKADEPFGDPQSKLVWSEFNTCKTIRNPYQAKVDISKPKKLWFYLGKTSTEAKAQYTGDLAVRRNDPTANFLESVRMSTAAAAVPPRRSFPASYPSGVNMHAVNAARPPRPYNQSANLHPNKPQVNRVPVTQDRTYHGKYAITDPVPHNYKAKVSGHVDPQALHNQRTFQQNASRQSPLQPYNAQSYSASQTYSSQGYRAPSAPMGSIAPTAPMMATASQHSSLLHADIYGHSMTQYPHSQQQQERRPHPQAPVANMMGGGTTATKNPFSRPPSANKPAPEYGNIIEQLRKASGTSTVPLSEKYIYLHEADKLRPAVYQSPYAQEGGFTPAYQPNPTAAPRGRPKSGSLSEDYLKQCATSQQEGIKSQLIRDREGMIERQGKARQELHDQEREAEKRNYQKQQSIYRSAPVNPLSSRMSAQSQNLNHQHPTPPPQPSYYRPPTYQYDSYSAYQEPPQHQYSASNAINLAHSLQPPTYASHSPQTPIPNHNSSHSRPTGGLQFQSPQDFQMQMQREAQQQEWAKSQGSFDHFFRGLQNAAANGGDNGEASVYGSGGGGGQATSPLKAEKGGGAEMLPVMGGRF